MVKYVEMDVGSSFPQSCSVFVEAGIPFKLKFYPERVESAFSLSPIKRFMCAVHLRSLALVE